jgi:CheY-like chemotaxis protein
MVADDHDDTRDLMRFLLERWGYRVVEAADGAEAVEVAGRVRPSLVLLDIGLPGLDGLGAARRLRECDGLGAVPVVAVSGHAAARDRDEAFAAGCVGYLTKPFTSAQLSALVTQFLP